MNCFCNCIFFFIILPALNWKTRTAGKMEKWTNGLVLSGGGARGFAHLGALQAMEENNWRIDLISGVSAGALTGVFYAAGFKPRDILNILKELEMFDYSKVSMPRGGFLELTGMRKLFKKALKVTQFSDLHMPFYVAVTNLNKGRIEYINKGNVIDAVVASSSIPILFRPQKIGNDFYVDGGVFDNLPAKPVRGITRRLIGIHVNPIHETDQVKTIRNVAARVFQLSVASTVSTSMALCDLIVQPRGLYKYHILDNSNADELYEVGYEEMHKILKQQKTPFKSSIGQLLKIPR